MTADSHLVCRRCGFANAPGDQFCGSCSAFLEWEGAGAGPDATVTVPEPRDPDVPVVGSPGTGASATATEPVEATQPYPVTPVQPAPPVPRPGLDDGTLVRCPACGIANAASRTFCQSCGTRLADASRVGAVSREQIEAAVSAPGRPVPVTTTVIRPAGAAPAQASSSGGIGKWIAVMAVLGLLVGVGIVAASTLLQGEGPASDATSAPSLAGASVAPGTSDGPGGASGDPAASGAASGPTAAPAKAGPLPMTRAAASSVVGDLEKFQPARAIDGDPKTAWQEGAKAEKGQWIEVAFDPARVSAVVLTNGYNASKALYRGNRRLKDVEISIAGGKPVKVRLKDTGSPQTFKLTPVAGATTLRITILSTYAAKKTSVAGTPFDDAALGEIEVIGVTGS